MTTLDIPKILSMKDLDREFYPVAYLPEDFFQEVELGVFSGWNELDKLLGGFRRGELTIITGDTAVGKTTFCVQLMYQFALKGYPVWINSYEMQPKVIFRKLASLALQKDMKLLAFSPDDRRACQAHFEKYPCCLPRESTETNVEALHMQLEKAKSYNIFAVLIDHLYFISSSVKRPNIHEEIQEVMHKLHQCAINYDLHLVVVAHPKQKEAGAHFISLNDLKGGSSIKQYADNVISLTRLKRSDPKDKRLQISVLKNRFFGSEGKCFLKYNAEIDGFVPF